MKNKCLLYILLLAAYSSNAQWTTQTSNTTSWLESVSFPDKNTGYVAGRPGTILKTIDGGSNWVSITPGNADYYSIFFTNVDTGYVVGGQGLIQKVTDGSSNWTTLNSGTTKSLHSAFFTNSNYGFVVGSNGTILKTTDGGSKWISCTSGTTQELNSVFFTDKDTGYVVGGTYTPSRIILKTTNGGANWVTQDSSSNSTLRSVFFTDKNTGYAVGMSKILKTINGGITWTELYFNGYPSYTSVYFVDSNNGYVAGTSGKVLKTVDGGLNWVTLFTGTAKNFKSAFFTDANTGYIVGDKGLILKTTTGGTTNCNNSISFTAGQHGINDYFFDVIPDTTIETHGSPYGEDYNLLIDINGDGINDFKLNTYESAGMGGKFKSAGISPLNNNKVAFGLWDTCYTAALAHAYDYGDTIYDCASWWNMDLYLAYYCWLQGGTINCNRNTFTGTNDKYIGVKILVPPDTGYGWIKVSNVYAAGLTLKEYACTKNVVGIAYNQKKSLLKIYPNPVSDNLKIEITQMVGESVLYIYNINGQEIKKYNLKNNTGQIDVSNLPKGIYIIKFTNDQIVEVRKILKE